MTDVVKKTAVSGTGDRIALNSEIQSLYEEYYIPLVRFFSRKLSKDEDPEDMTQQVFIRLLKSENHKKYTFTRRLVFHVANNTLIDRLRWRKSHRVEKQETIDNHTIVNEAPLPDRVLQGKQQLDSFFGHFDNLPLKCKEVFLLHRICEMPQKEIAEHLGISVNSVRRYMVGATSRLRSNIQNIEDL